MSVYLAEFIGTAIMIYLGEGVVANIVLKKTGGNAGGTLMINFAWAFAVVIPALIFGPHGGAHFNSALSISFAVVGLLEWSLLPGYILAQFAGAIVGACLVYISYKEHFDITEKESHLGIFATGPSIASPVINLICEALATFILVFAILGIAQTTGVEGSPAALGTFAVGGIIFGIGASLGGTTGYAINPARDLGPRIAYAFILPFKEKTSPNWGYAWIPVVGPIIGAILGAVLATSILP